MNKLFWYKEQLEREVQKKTEDGDEMELETIKEKVSVVVGAFNLDHVSAVKIAEHGIEVYLQLPYEQMLPNPTKPRFKMINKEKQVIGYHHEVFTMPMGVTLTDTEDIERFKSLTIYPNV
jgi:hypothetical protein